jgi:hypothetical protein
MSSLFDFQKWETEFRSSKVSMELRPLKSREVAEFLPFFMAVRSKSEKAKKGDQLSFDDPEEIKTVFAAQAKAVDILPNAVRNLAGVDDNWQTICEEVLYLPLVIDILVRLMTISYASKEDSKNSGGPSSQASPADSAPQQ